MWSGIILFEELCIFKLQEWQQNELNKVFEYTFPFSVFTLQTQKTSKCCKLWHFTSWYQGFGLYVISEYTLEYDTLQISHTCKQPAHGITYSHH